LKHKHREEPGRSRCFATSVVVVGLSILYELEKLSLKLLLLLLLLLFFFRKRQNADFFQTTD
jgi:hypothetical protein